MRFIKIIGIFAIFVLLLSSVSAFGPKDYVDSNSHSGNSFNPSGDSYRPSDGYMPGDNSGFKGVDGDDSPDAPPTTDYSGRGYDNFKGQSFDGNAGESTIGDTKVTCNGGGTPEERVHNALNCDAPGGSSTPSGDTGSDTPPDSSSDSFNGLYWRGNDYNIPNFGKSDTTDDEGDAFISWFWRGGRLDLPKDIGGEPIDTPNKELPYSDLSLSNVRIKDSQGRQVNFDELVTGEKYTITVELDNLGSAKVEDARVVLSVADTYSYTTTLFDIDGKESRAISVGGELKFDSAGTYTLNVDAFPAEEDGFQSNNELSISLVVDDNAQERPAARYTEADAKLYVDLAKEKVSQAREAIDKAEKALEQGLDVDFNSRDVDYAWDDYKDAKDYKNDAKDYLALNDFDNAVERSKGSIDISKNIISDLYFNWELLDSNNDTVSDNSTISTTPVSVVETGKTAAESARAEDLIEIKTTPKKEDASLPEDTGNKVRDALVFAGLSAGVLVVLLFNIILSVKLFKKK